MKFDFTKTLSLIKGGLLDHEWVKQQLRIDRRD